MTEPGILYVVATPIGNLADISNRAVMTLSNCDLVAAEDTRHSAKLMQHIGASKQMVALHEHNETEKSAWFVQQLLAGKSVALISDAGTPLINDPGYHVVRSCREQGIQVVPVPGACAITAALSASGLPTDSFAFKGFFPIKQAAKEAEINFLLKSDMTHVYYESTHRISGTLGQLANELPESQRVVLAKELTKSFEHFESGSAKQVLHWLQQEPARSKGEFVLLIGAGEAQSSDLSDENIKLFKMLASELPLKKASAIMASHTGMKKNALYQLGLDLQQQ